MPSERSLGCLKDSAFVEDDFPSSPPQLRKIVSFGRIDLIKADELRNPTAARSPSHFTRPDPTTPSSSSPSTTTLSHSNSKQNPSSLPNAMRVLSVLQWSAQLCGKAFYRLVCCVAVLVFMKWSSMQQPKLFRVASKTSRVFWRLPSLMWK
jgi:hypothetical protein